MIQFFDSRKTNIVMTRIIQSNISTRDTVCMTALCFVLHIGIAAINIFSKFESQRSDSAPMQAKKSNCLWKIINLQI